MNFRLLWFDRWSNSCFFLFNWCSFISLPENGLITTLEIVSSPPLPMNLLHNQITAPYILSELFLLILPLMISSVASVSWLYLLTLSLQKSFLSHFLPFCMLVSVYLSSSILISFTGNPLSTTAAVQKITG